jgi:hypothetical protein
MANTKFNHIASIEHLNVGGFNNGTLKSIRNESEAKGFSKNM